MKTKTLMFASILFAGMIFSSCEKDQVNQVVPAPPKTQELLRVTPNPFNDEATIQYWVEDEQKVNLSIVSSASRLKNVLVDGTKESGFYEYNLDGTKMPAGVYTVTLVLRDKTITKVIEKTNNYHPDLEDNN